MLCGGPSLETGGAWKLWARAGAKLWGWPRESPEVPVLGMTP